MIRRFSLVIAGLIVAGMLAGCGDPFARGPRVEPYTPPPAARVEEPKAPPVAEPLIGNPATDGIIGPKKPRPGVIDRIEVKKGERRMTLWRDDQPYRVYLIALGPNSVGHKRFEGDGRTPEGDYVIDVANPNSQFYLSLRVNYPSAEDRAWAKARRVKPGGDIFIHGHGLFAGVSGKRRIGDWTEGCIAVTNAEIEEIYALVGTGTPIRITP